MNFEWVPNISIGDFYFDKYIDIKLLPFDVKKVKSETSEEPWSCYEIIGSQTRFSVEEGVLVSVECSEQFIYEKINLIGLNHSQLLKVIDKDLALENDWGEEKEYSCDDLGILIWENDDVVESISVSE